MKIGQEEHGPEGSGFGCTHVRVRIRFRAAVAAAFAVPGFQDFLVDSKDAIGIVAVAVSVSLWIRR